MPQSDQDLSRAYLAAIIESSDDAIISKNLDGVIQTFNAAAERLFGYRANEVIGKPITILLPRERLHEEAEILEKLRRGERIDHFETVRITRDGRRVDISLSVSPVRDSSGTVVGAAKIARDITERKRAAEALTAQREWFRVTLGSIGDAVIASDARGCITFVNESAARLTGWTSEEATGRPLVDVFRIVNERTRAPLENPADQVLATGSPMALANHSLLVARDGSEHPIADSAAPIRDDLRRMLGVVLVFRDVTEHRHAEAELHAVAREREMLLEAERRARADAERANRVKDDFVAMVSHELRTPLSAILGWTHILQENAPADDTLRHGIEVIARNTRAQTQLISDLLDISRIASGKLLLEVETVDLAVVIAESLETVQHAAFQKNVTLDSHFEGASAITKGDPSRLRQVVWNLLSNAIKFTPRGGRIEVTLRNTGSHAEIIVRDTGDGIPAEEISGVFERFRQSGTATTRRYGGLGLGLAIVRHLVELHSGAIRASSEGRDKGATFTVELPLVLTAEAEAPVERDGVSATVDRISLAGTTVLLVEDEPDMRQLVQRILEDHGATVLPAASAAGALELLDQGPDILVSDIHLPHVDGYQLIREIRRRGDAHAQIPAVALTAFARAEDRTRAMRAGFQNYISKPFEATELLLTVASFGDIIRSMRARAR